MIDIQKYKTLLEEEKTDLEVELSAIAQPSSEDPHVWEAIQNDTTMEADPNDQADHLDEYQENRAVVEVLNPQYKEVLSALDRIEQGTYGTCSVCGNEIEEDRLEADPSASTCKVHMS